MLKVSRDTFGPFHFESKTYSQGIGHQAKKMNRTVVQLHWSIYQTAKCPAKGRDPQFWSRIFGECRKSCCYGGKALRICVYSHVLHCKNMAIITSWLIYHGRREIFRAVWQQQGDEQATEIFCQLSPMPCTEVFSASRPLDQMSQQNQQFFFGKFGSISAYLWSFSFLFRIKVWI